MKRHACTALACLALAACASTAESDDPPAVPGGADVARSVALCTTRIDDLQSRLGTPSRDGRLGNLRVMTWIVEWDPLVRYLGVAVDPRGVVVDRVWDLPSEVTWSPADRCQAS